MATKKKSLTKKSSSKRSRKSSKPKTLNRNAKPPKKFRTIGVYGVDADGRLWDLGRHTPKSAR